MTTSDISAICSLLAIIGIVKIRNDVNTMTTSDTSAILNYLLYPLNIQTDTRRINFSKIIFINKYCRYCYDL